MSIIEVAAIGLQQDTERLRVISHNVANVSTPGYKRQLAVLTPFSGLVDAEAGKYAGASVHTDMSTGRLRSTGSPLDVSLDGREFLMVSSASGDSLLSRGGSLHGDASGRLVTSAGQVVQGLGGDIRLPPGATQIRISSDGKVFADDVQVGTLQVVSVAAEAPIVSIGDGLFIAPNKADMQAVSTPRVLVGQSEASNVVSSQEMVELMTTIRHAESMARLIQGADEMLEKSIRKFGEA
ncbi:hypothetical protein DBR47_03410 [Paucibacter sp. KBW04]|uniref:flagellar hook-basal body protein n=1 Tax=Paucibacter sp. KBW04 TaxID=2153361 RepID=UPI000F55A86E|nr:flagellar hook basal-body protein [Paucibacter sp. KBW04]RQO63586.1 hypothetical protein DBR47_03410 [Paucibacter sp. KBW04]